MADEEVNIISHLLEVEQNASLLTKTAQEDANKMISEAKVKADEEFKTKFDKLVIEMQNEDKQKFDKIQNHYKNLMDDYEASIRQKVQNKKAFNEFMKSVTGV